MKKLVFILPVIVIILLLLIVILFSKSNNSQNNTNDYNKINVVAAENFYGDIFSNIGGNNVNIINILSNSNQDPHEYEATTSDAKKIEKADIIIENGLGYDSFINKILLNSTNKEIINVGALANLTEKDNPHIWYNLDIIKELSLNIKDKLSKLDKKNQIFYENNYIKFINSLNQVDLICANIKNKYNLTNIIAIERVGDYLLNRCGFNLIKNEFQKAIEEGNDPSISSISFFENQLNMNLVQILIYNNQTQSQITEKEKVLAQKNNIPVVSLTETMPSNMNYIDWMTYQLNNINNVLKNGK